MKVRKFRLAIAAALGAAMLALGPTAPARAQSAMLKLYVDPATGQVFTKPGRGRTLLTEVPAAALDTSAIEQKVEQKTQAQLDANKQQISQLVQQNAQLQMSNSDMERQMAEIKPAWRSYIDNFQDKFRVGTLVYGDYRLYTHTGFQPQELTQINNPGPQNNIFNSFDITRTYLNFYFFPTDGWTARITPNIYRQVGGSTADAIGNGTSYSSNLDGNLGFRLKYGYLEYNKLFNGFDPMKGDAVQMGQIPNAFVSWEEDLYGFRYVNLTPWNYYSLSSSQVGLAVNGPIKFNELQYADYNVGVYDNSSFHAQEETNTKQAMARISAYPFGAKWRFDGLGLTWFFDYGYGNVAPDTVGVKPFYQAPEAHIMRSAFLAHYTAENWGIIGEFDWGHNAFSSGNLFSGSGPSTTTTFDIGKTAYSYANFNTMTTAFLNNGRSVQNGFDLMGHYHIPRTPFTAFGLWSLWHPNTNVQSDPLDFQRWVVGVQYQVNEYLRFAIDNQNINYYRGQTDMSQAYANSFAPGTFKKPGDKQILDAVPVDTHSFWINMEFSY
ncbi:MAG: hypothetical protein ACLQAT_26060 [Candidatus Binataceae bacterium]